MQVRVRVDLTAEILRILKVTVSLRSSAEEDSTFTKMSYAPKMPSASFTLGIAFSCSIIEFSEPRSQLSKMYANIT